MVKNLKVLRKEKNISQQQLANILEISQQAINKYENHKVEPDISTLIAMADYFGVTLDYLVGRFESEDSEDNVVITDSEKELVFNFKKLTESEKTGVKALIETFNNLK